MARGGIVNHNVSIARPSWDEEYYGFTIPPRFVRDEVATVYIIQSGGCADLLKIGVSKRVAERMRQFEAGNPLGVKLMGSRDTPACLAWQVERRVHDHFRDCAVGREWFRVELGEALKAVNFWHRRARSALKWHELLNGPSPEAAR